MLDFDRGLTRRRHPSGAMISEVKSDPGRWLDDVGNDVAPEIAAAAGFDVLRSMRARDKRQRLAEAMREIEAAYEESEHSYYLKDIGGGLCQVIDESGRELLERPTTRLRAYELMQALAAAGEGEEEVEEEDEEQVEEPARGPFRMVFAGPGKFRVKGPDGEALSDPVTKDEAKALIEELKHGEAEAAGGTPAEVDGDAASGTR